MERLVDPIELNIREIEVDNYLEKEFTSDIVTKYKSYYNTPFEPPTSTRVRLEDFTKTIVYDDGVILANDPIQSPQSSRMSVSFNNGKDWLHHVFAMSISTMSTIRIDKESFIFVDQETNNVYITENFFKTYRPLPNVFKKYTLKDQYDNLSSINDVFNVGSFSRCKNTWLFCNCNDLTTSDLSIDIDSNKLVQNSFKISNSVAGYNTEIIDSNLFSDHYKMYIANSENGIEDVYYVGLTVPVIASGNTHVSNRLFNIFEIDMRQAVFNNGILDKASIVQRKMTNDIYLYDNYRIVNLEYILLDNNIYFNFADNIRQEGEDVDFLTYIASRPNFIPGRFNSSTISGTLTPDANSNFGILYTKIIDNDIIMFYLSDEILRYNIHTIEKDENNSYKLTKVHDDYVMHLPGLLLETMTIEPTTEMTTSLIGPNNNFIDKLDNYKTPYFCYSNGKFYISCKAIGTDNELDYVTIFINHNYIYDNIGNIRHLGKAGMLLNSSICGNYNIGNGRPIAINTGKDVVSIVTCDDNYSYSLDPLDSFTSPNSSFAYGLSDSENSLTLNLVDGEFKGASFGTIKPLDNIKILEGYSCLPQKELHDVNSMLYNMNMNDCKVYSINNSSLVNSGFTSYVEFDNGNKFIFDNRLVHAACRYGDKYIILKKSNDRSLYNNLGKNTHLLQQAYPEVGSAICGSDEYYLSWRSVCIDYEVCVLDNYYNYSKSGDPNDSDDILEFLKPSLTISINNALDKDGITLAERSAENYRSTSLLITSMKCINDQVIIFSKNNNPIILSKDLKSYSELVIVGYENKTISNIEYVKGNYIVLINDDSVPSGTTDTKSYFSYRDCSKVILVGKSLNTLNISNVSLGKFITNIQYDKYRDLIYILTYDGLEILDSDLNHMKSYTTGDKRDKSRLVVNSNYILDVDLPKVRSVISRNRPGVIGEQILSRSPIHIGNYTYLPDFYSRDDINSAEADMQIDNIDGYIKYNRSYYNILHNDSGIVGTITRGIDTISAEGIRGDNDTQGMVLPYLNCIGLSTDNTVAEFSYSTELFSSTIPYIGPVPDAPSSYFIHGDYLIFYRLMATNYIIFKINRETNRLIFIGNVPLTPPEFNDQPLDQWVFIESCVSIGNSLFIPVKFRRFKLLNRVTISNNRITEVVHVNVQCDYNLRWILDIQKYNDTVFMSAMITDDDATNIFVIGTLELSSNTNTTRLNIINNLKFSYGRSVVLSGNYKVMSFKFKDNKLLVSPYGTNVLEYDIEELLLNNPIKYVYSDDMSIQYNKLENDSILEVDSDSINKSINRNFVLDNDKELVYEILDKLDKEVDVLISRATSYIGNSASEIKTIRSKLVGDFNVLFDNVLNEYDIDFVNNSELYQRIYNNTIDRYEILSMAILKEQK